MALPTSTNYGQSVTKYAVASETKDWGSLADAATETAEDITVTGAQLGDFVLVSMSIDTADLLLNGTVTAANTVTVTINNESGGTVNLASATLYVMVIPREVI